MSNQTKNNNLDYLIDPTFTNANRLQMADDIIDDRTSFSKYYVPNVEIKDFKGCVRYIFASLIFASKREHL